MLLDLIVLAVKINNKQTKPPFGLKLSPFYILKKIYIYPTNCGPLLERLFKSLFFPPSKNNFSIKLINQFNNFRSVCKNRNGNK